MPTALLCNLDPIARRAGVPRIAYPAGDPSLEPGAERMWRRALCETALRAIATAVSGPTVFETPWEAAR